MLRGLELIFSTANGGSELIKTGSIIKCLEFIIFMLLWLNNLWAHVVQRIF